MIELKSLNRREAIRYLGGSKTEINDEMTALLDKNESELIKAARPKYLYKIIDLPNESITPGEDIKRHLSDCKRAFIMCATLGAEVDRLIRIKQISDMPSAVVLDSLASVAIEQVCGQVDRLVADMFPDCFLTFRFSPGYGDYPIELQRYFLAELDAGRKIGLNTNESFLLIPSKSVTAIAGISDKPIEKKKRGCAVCNLRAECKYRKNGEHCGF